MDNNLFLCDGDGDGARPLISALYFVDGGDPRAHLLDPDPKAQPPETLGGDVVLKRAPDGDFAHVEPRADALVLWRSKPVTTRASPSRRGAAPSCGTGSSRRRTPWSGTATRRPRDFSCCLILRWTQLVATVTSRRDNSSGNERLRNA